MSSNQSALKNTSDSDIICMLDESVYQDDKARMAVASAEANDSHNSFLSLSCDEWETDMMRKMREEKTCFLCDKKFENQGMLLVKCNFLNEHKFFYISQKNSVFT